MAVRDLVVQKAGREVSLIEAKVAGRIEPAQMATIYFNRLHGAGFYDLEYRRKTATLGSSERAYWEQTYSEFERLFKKKESDS